LRATADWDLVDHVRRGELVRMLADWDSTEAPPLYVAYAPGATRLPRVRAVVDFATALMAQVNEQRGAEVIPSPSPAWRRGARAKASAWLRR
jgi:hypothetical protein